MLTHATTRRFGAWSQGAPKLRVAIVGGGLAGLSTAVELLDQGWVTRLELGPTASP